MTGLVLSSGRGHSLELKGIGHAFGATVALDAVDLSVAAGELIALLGPSGCGKTTMLQIIAGFLRPTKGEVRFDGARVEHIPANRRRIGMVFQNYALFPHLTVFENVAYGLRARKAPRAEGGGQGSPRACRHAGRPPPWRTGRRELATPRSKLISCHDPHVWLPQ